MANVSNNRGSVAWSPAHQELLSSRTDADFRKCLLRAQCRGATRPEWQQCGWWGPGLQGGTGCSVCPLSSRYLLSRKGALGQEATTPKGSQWSDPMRALACFPGCFLLRVNMRCHVRCAVVSVVRGKSRIGYR